jgi:hypothetical protein
VISHQNGQFVVLPSLDPSKCPATVFLESLSFCSLQAAATADVTLTGALPLDRGFVRSVGRSDVQYEERFHERADERVEGSVGRADERCDE